MIELLLLLIMQAGYADNTMPVCIAQLGVRTDSEGNDYNVYDHYDCDWLLKVVSSDWVYCNQTLMNACTDINKKTIVIAEDYLYGADNCGRPSLWHEILHAMCLCDYHKGDVC